MFSVAPTFWGDIAGAAAARNAIITQLGSADATTHNIDSFFVPYATTNTPPTDLTTGTDTILNTTDRYPLLATDVRALGNITDSDVSLVTRRPFASFHMTYIPVPPAVWLFGFGLLGLIGVARRKVRV